MSIAEEKQKPISVTEIMDLIPHRYPMLLVDRILEYVPHERRSYRDWSQPERSGDHFC